MKQPPASLREISSRSNEDPNFFLERAKSMFEKISRENDYYNSFLRSYFTPALIERLFSKITENKRGKKLFGTLFSVKDNISVENHPLSFGLLPPLEESSRAHAEIVKLSISQGSTLAGSTNLDPGCIDCLGDNPFYGRTLNPNYLELIPAGSSSGAAAAVAAGLCDFAFGTDSGGSVRAPAAACGVCGLRTSPELLPTGGIILLNDELDGLGLLARQLDDLKFVLECLTDKRPDHQPDRNLKFLVPTAEDLVDLDPQLSKSFQSVVSCLEEDFSVTRLNTSLEFQKASQIRKEIAIFEFPRLIMKHGVDPQILPDNIKAIVLAGRKQEHSTYDQACREKSELSERVTALLDQETFIVCPSIPDQPPAWIDLHKKQNHSKSRNLVRFLALANLCSLPALTVPEPVQKDQFPFSFQIIGSNKNDFSLLQAGDLLLQVLSQSK